LAAAPTALVGERTERRAPQANECDWRVRAVCRSADPELLFVSGARQREAASICRNCPVKWECAASALDNKEEYGVWGGLTERQRRILLRNHPDVQSWAAFLAQHQARRAAR
jgi:WhiB family redox-sensing transcriptional regulator